MKWFTAALLFLTIIVLMVVNSAEFFFHQPFYEMNDWAANSLSVNRAKHFSELYGNYSRWGFHHPGPSFMYLYALGEWLLFDTLHLVAAPFNGQLFAHLFLMTGYLVAILTVFSRWLPGKGWPGFIPAALAVSALHFSAMANLAPDLVGTLHAPSAIGSPWSAHALVMPFLCLLTAGASVAAGQGRDLPLLALADGCLIHLHVAQPLFVVPLSLLAYAGLCWQGWRSRRVPWQEFRRSHLTALGILAVFALPIVGDLFRGADSNFAMIINHMRTHHGEHKPLVRSLVYFLQFGSYTGYPGYKNTFGHYDVRGLIAYLGRNAAYYILWLAAVALALRPLAAYLRKQDAKEPLPDAGAPDTHRFLAWGGVFLAAALALTLVWGVIQDGPMTYYNAWFNYSIYHFIALLALASLCARPMVTTPERWRAICVGGMMAALGVCVLLAEPLRIHDPVAYEDAATRAAVEQAIADSKAPGGPPVTKLLLFNQETWAMAAGIALHLDRAGQPFVVPARWAFVVGQEHLWHYLPEVTPLEHLQILRLHKRHAKTIQQPAYGLQKTRGAFTLESPLIDPADPERASISFPRKDNTFWGCQVLGWSNPEDWGTWNNGTISLLAIRPKSVGDSDVEVRMDVMPLLAPEYGLTEQSMRVFFNGEQLGRERFFSLEEPALTFTIPSELWESAARAPTLTPTVLEFRFPHAAVPGLLYLDHRSYDLRMLAVGFRQIQFGIAKQRVAEERK